MAGVAEHLQIGEVERSAAAVQGSKVMNFEEWGNAPALLTLVACTPVAPRAGRPPIAE